MGKGNVEKRKRKAASKLGSDLPIHRVARKIIATLSENESVVLIGETGSGKSTQLPQILADCRRFHIFPRSGLCITQPRRVAAVTIAERVAIERKIKVGTEVGYAVRFQDCSTNETSIKYVTEGILLRESLSDGLLTKYSVVILDEAHERTLNFDILLGLLKSIQKRRREDSNPKIKSLKLIVMSATLEAEKFCKYLDCPKLEIPGRKFPVEVFYTVVPEKDYMEAAVCATLQLHFEELEGDILVFLTGQEEIENAEGLISEHVQNFPPDAKPLSIVMLYAAMPPELQMRAFKPAPKGTRKIILATNIAETSLTIDGVKYVVDPGFVKQRQYNPMTCSDTLSIIPISKAQAKQRTGRAGRQGPGKAFHLFPESEFFKLTSSSTPEILRTNLANTVLQMKAMGIEDVLQFEFLEPPPKSALVRSFELLLSLDALNSSGHISKEGRQMCNLPVDPMLAKAILASAKVGCVDEVIKIVSLLSVESILHFPKKKKDEANQAHLKFLHEKGDMLTLLQIMNTFQNVKEEEKTKWCRQNFVNARSLRKAHSIYKQLFAQMKQDTNLGGASDVSECKSDDIMKCICAGYFSNAAQRMPDGTYKILLSGQKVQLHPASVMFKKRPECIVFIELVQTTKLYARNIGKIDASWLTEMFPDIFVVG